jgi:hypothetical protein
MRVAVVAELPAPLVGQAVLVVAATVVILRWSQDKTERQTLAVAVEGLT